MKKHTRNYLNAYYPNWGPDDLLLCEICLIKYDTKTISADIHHIEPKGMGGSKLKDNPENLISVCRTHHNFCHEDPPRFKITKNEQKRIHKEFTKRQQGHF